MTDKDNHVCDICGFEITNDVYYYSKHYEETVCLGCIYETAREEEINTYERKHND